MHIVFINIDDSILVWSVGSQNMHILVDETIKNIPYLKQRAILSVAYLNCAIKLFIVKLCFCDVEFKFCMKR